MILFLTLALLAQATMHGHHDRVHEFKRRAVETEMVTVTEIETVIVTVEQKSVSVISTSTAAISLTTYTSSSAVIPTFKSFRPHTNPSQPVSPVSSDVSAAATEPIKLANTTTGFNDLNLVSGMAMIRNSCPYPVYIWSESHPSRPSPAAKGALLPAMGLHTETMRACPEGGVSLKISKDNTLTAPMQFEYTVWTDHVTVSYDISYLNCMKNGNGEKDLSGCAGHDGGIQAVGGGSCKHFACPANQWCDHNAYVVAEYGYLPNAPVGGCTVDKGIAFELCAGVKVQG
jgi:hypothetical protein